AALAFACCKGSFTSASSVSFARAAEFGEDSTRRWWRYPSQSFGRAHYRLPGRSPKGPKKLAEREGFEPSIRLPVCRISSAVLSTAQPPLQRAQKLRGLGRI